MNSNNNINNLYIRIVLDLLLLVFSPQKDLDGEYKKKDIEKDYVLGVYLEYRKPFKFGKTIFVYKILPRVCPLLLKSILEYKENELIIDFCDETINKNDVGSILNVINQNIQIERLKLIIDNTDIIDLELMTNNTSLKDFVIVSNNDIHKKRDSTYALIQQNKQKIKEIIYSLKLLPNDLSQIIFLYLD